MSDLSRRLGVPLTTLHREVERLVEAELIGSRNMGRSRVLSANTTTRAYEPLTKLLELSFGPQVVVAEEFADIARVDRVIIFGSWAERYAGTPGAPPNDVDVLVVGSPDRADVYEAADRAQQRLGMQVNPVIRSSDQWASPTDGLVEQIASAAHVDVMPAAEVAP